jgi:hypothetical protein
VTRFLIKIVMAGLVPATHRATAEDCEIGVSIRRSNADRSMDGRDKPGHDELGV